MSHSQRQDRLVKLVRKLLELARSNSNAHEAGQALSRAQKLMAKYGITELEANISSIQQAPTKGAPSQSWDKIPEWMSLLTWTVANA
ncbi:TPA: DUF2786 domain-containing protein, partial [Serratia rubidaea]|nr:DUF2786 domain-containing protein [Serratia rubidaea]